MSYQPKGGMCVSCQHRLRDCSHLPFSAYPVIERAGEVRIVRCAEYVRATGEESK